MKSVESVQVLVCASESETVEDVQHILEGAGYSSTTRRLENGDFPESADYQMVVIEGSHQPAAALQCCRVLRARVAECVLPILFLTEDHAPAARLASLEAGADTYLLRPFASGELLAQVRAFLRNKELHDRLLEKTTEVQRVNKRLQQAHQQIDEELELARCIQLSFLPQSLPQVSGTSFAVRYLLRGRVGGDFYDVFRLDEKHVGLYVADAMGHGVPASLLTIFVKKGVRAKEVFAQQYRLVPPSEVLQRLNRDLIEQSLSGHPFITMVYALYNHNDRTLRFARAGHPYPLYIPYKEEPCLWEVPGSLLGVFDADFPMQTHSLKPGDKVLLYSDGIDSASFEGCRNGTESLLACAKRHRTLPIQEFVDQLARDLCDGTGRRLDDLTLLGLEVSE